MNSTEVSIETISNRSDSLDSNDSIKKHKLKQAWVKRKREREKISLISKSPKISDVLKYLTFLNIDKIND